MTTSRGEAVHDLAVSELIFFRPKHDEERHEFLRRGYDASMAKNSGLSKAERKRIKMREKERKRILAQRRKAAKRHERQQPLSPSELSSARQIMDSPALCRPRGWRGGFVGPNAFSFDVNSEPSSSDEASNSHPRDGVEVEGVASGRESGLSDMEAMSASLSLLAVGQGSKSRRATISVWE